MQRRTCFVSSFVLISDAKYSVVLLTSRYFTTGSELTEVRSGFLKPLQTKSDEKT